MKVYRVQQDIDRYQYFLPAEDSGWEQLTMDCSPRGAGWTPPPIFIYEPILLKGDFFNFSSSTLVFNKSAYKNLHRHLVAAGEILPLYHEGETYYLLNVTNCVNCLNQHKSQWKIDESSGQRIEIKKYEFHRDRWPEADIFKIPETKRGEILVKQGVIDLVDEFIYAYEHSGLKGLIFKELWEG